MDFISNDSLVEEEIKGKSVLVETEASCSASTSTVVTTSLPLEGCADETVEEAAAEEEDKDKLQVAWEVLDTARVIYLKSSNASAPKKLTDVYMTLGDLSLENENFAQAADDFLNGVQLMEASLTEDDRILAESYFKIAIAYEYGGSLSAAIEYSKKALVVVQSRITNLSQTCDANTTELAELKSLVPEIEAKIVDLQAAEKSKEEQMKSTAASDPSTSATSQNALLDSSLGARDISGLVKRKAAAESPAPSNESDAKRPRAEDSCASDATHK